MYKTHLLKNNIQRRRSGFVKMLESKQEQVCFEFLLEESDVVYLSDVFRKWVPESRCYVGVSPVPVTCQASWRNMERIADSSYNKPAIFFLYIKIALKKNQEQFWGYSNSILYYRNKNCYRGTSSKCPLLLTVVEIRPRAPW